MKAAGLDVRQDEAGNLIGRLPGANPHLPAVVTGSHIDTVREGGRFDGALGVLAGIEVLRTIREQGFTHTRPLEVICFTDEEGVRFGTGYLGSRAMAGLWNDEWLSLADIDGITLQQAMSEAGITPAHASAARRKHGDVHAYVELHIEQGRVLEHHELEVGIVTSIYGHRWLKITMYGQADHGGTTPMGLRRDAMVAASEAILGIEQTAIDYGGVATVGTLQVKPGSINVIPGEVIFTVDVRHGDGEGLDQLASAIEEAVRQCAIQRDVAVNITMTDSDEPVQASEQVTRAIQRACEGAGYSPFMMNGGAGHDAVAMHALTDIGLILIRSKDGISHHPAEWSSPEDCVAGANILLGTLLLLANN
ncbi:Zn-dependent hydrolase [Paenibacillus sp. JCM 10914]|uniref:Zn-dependent hydrolase n=1 Tax=Paenibacillus sp. JCM 10914 TaxID=1236974 RepID=UPI0003CC5C2F|nr:Zn-dependent hydrolase [Paenibacillus sp. JCM 10914]GAE06323.1 N-carbamoyl-L-amino acid hydrolase [Paenibacillus sp. JCM 10914]